MQEKAHFKSHNLNKFDIEFNNSLFSCRVFWARVVSSENESLFTQYTKHTFYEIQYALEGKIGLLIDENRRLDVKESDFVIIPPDTYHQIVDADSVGARFIMAFSLQFSNKAPSGAIKHFNNILSRKETKNMRMLLSILLEKNFNESPVRKRAITSLLESFFLEIVEAVLPGTPFYKKEDSEAEAENRINHILSFIRRNGGIGISVTDIAKEFCISERHLCRIVFEKTGKTPKELINEEKLKKIEEYMVSTSLSLSEISELCGFSDSYAMNKFFKRYNKVTPTVFRKPTK